MDYSENYIFGNRIKIRQPEKGFRVSIDSIFLQSVLNPGEDEKVLDVGSGVGAASLCLAWRKPKVNICGIESQRSNVTLANANIRLNDFQETVETVLGNLIEPPPRLAAGSFNYVMTNPPYHKSNDVKLSSTDHKNISNFMHEIDLAQWIRFCLLMLKHKGHFVMIHSTSYLDEIMSNISGKLGNIKIFPFWTNEFKEAKRVIVVGQKGNKGSARLLHGLVLHKLNQDYTADAEAILRNAEPLKLE